MTSSAYKDYFSSQSSLNRSIWQVKWGKSNDFKFQNGALVLRSTAAEGWSNTGFMQSNYGKNSGTGYGVYTATASLNAHQGGGVCIDLWPSNNVWPGAELDLLETLGGERHTAYTNVHWRTAGGGDGDAYHAISLDLTAKNTYAFDWERGHLTYYINGREIFSTTSHVPLDAADGGINEAFGAEVVGAGNSATSSETDLKLYSMNYTPSGSSSTSAPVSSSGMQFISSKDAKVVVTSGEKLTEQGSGNTLVLPSSGSVSLSGPILSDVLDLKSAFSAAGWDGKMSDISKYVSASKTNGGADLDVLVHKASGAAVLSVTLVGHGQTTLAHVESRSVFS